MCGGKTCPTTLLGSALGPLQIKLIKEKREERVVTYLWERLRREEAGRKEAVGPGA